MRILILTQYFYPETNAPAHRHGYFSKYLAEQGHEVTVICGSPNYPAGVLFPGYKNKMFQSEKSNVVRVIRSWVWITPRKGFVDRILNYGSFMLSSFFAGLRVREADIILASSPPLPVVFSGYLLSKIKNIPLVTEIRDIWPESAYAVGMAKKNFFFRFMEKLERAVYKHSAKIIVNAEGIGRRLISDKNVPEEKINFIPNGADLDMFAKSADTAEIDKKYGTAGKFVVLYTGLIGLAQAPEVMIEAAKILKNEKNIKFLIVGEGALKSKCEKLANDYGLQNIVFAGGRPREEMPAVTQRADVAVIPYKNFGLFKDVIPSKMYDYLAAGKPMIINIDGEGAAIVRNSKSGLVVAPENPEELARAIMKIYRDKKLAEEMGENGRKYAQTHYDKKVIAKNLNELLISANNLEETETAGN